MGGLHIAVGSLFQDGTGASCARICLPDQSVVPQGWALGEGVSSTGSREIILERVVFDAFALATELSGRRQTPPKYICGGPGYWRNTDFLSEWFNGGLLTLAFSFNHFP